MKNLTQVGIISFVVFLFLISSTSTVSTGVYVESSNADGIDPNLDFDDVIHPHSTVITDVGIATPKIAEIRMVDPSNASDIQAKINSCPRSGCRIFIPAGNYTITNTIIINQSKSNIFLTGAASGHHQSDGGTVFIHGADINIINLTGVAIGGSYMVHDIRIENIYFKSDFSKRGYAIYARYTSIYGVKVINNYFSEFYDPAIALQLTWGVLVDHNLFYRCGNTVDDTYAIHYFNPSPGQNTFAMIINNHFILNDSNYGAIRTRDTTDSYVIGNHIEGGEYGINTGGGARVIGNYIYYAKERGIYSGLGNLVIEGNHIVMNPAGSTDSKGISTDSKGVTIIGNTVHGGILGGIWVAGDKSTITGNLVIKSGGGSSIRGGIVLFGSDYSVVANNVVKNCVSVSSGILLRGNTHSDIIIGNFVTNCTRGVYETVSAGYGNSTIAYNIVLNNTYNIANNGENTKVYKNRGYTTENGGINSVANEGTISHGLVSTPSYYVLTPTVVNRSIAVTSANSTHLVVGLYHTNGIEITSAENVSWYAEV